MQTGDAIQFQPWIMAPPIPLLQKLAASLPTLVMLDIDYPTHSHLPLTATEQDGPNCSLTAQVLSWFFASIDQVNCDHH